MRVPVFNVLVRGEGWRADGTCLVDWREGERWDSVDRAVHFVRLAWSQNDRSVFYVMEQHNVHDATCVLWIERLQDGSALLTDRKGVQNTVKDFALKMADDVRDSVDASLDVGSDVRVIDPYADVPF